MTNLIKVISKWTLVVFLALIMILSGGIYLGLNNSYDTFGQVSSTHLTNSVTVYRDKLGIPTIVGKTLKDVVYAQGYEFARDRLWQLEFYRSVANGELSRIIGPSQLSADIFLRKLGIKRAAIATEQRLPSNVTDLVASYVQGLNDYITSHKNSLPLEFQVLGVGPKLWTVADSLAVQGVMSYDLAFGGLQSELRRLDMIKAVGGAKSLDIIPITYRPASNYVGNLTKQDVSKLKALLPNNPLSALFGSFDRTSIGVGSNDWVVGGAHTVSGNPIVSNDMHLGLAAPGIWYQVNLIVSDGSFQVQGFSLPGGPFVVAGHNKNIAWGFTNTGLDAIDLFALNQNSTHYLMNGNTWKKFTYIDEKIPVKGQNPYDLKIKFSHFGVMNLTRNGYAVKWTLNVGYQRDQIFRSLVLLNQAKTAADIHNALYYFAVPGQNVVFATTSGDFGYQFTGLIPKRTMGFGVLPQNGSAPGIDWNGSIPYDQQLYVLNPSKGFFATANQEIDTRHLFYIAETYAVKYRGERINQFLSAKISANEKMTPATMKQLQADIYSLAVDDILTPVLSGLEKYDFTKLNANVPLIQKALGYLKTWDKKMYVKSIAASIFVTFRINFVHYTFVDKLGYNLTRDVNYKAHEALATFLKNPTNNPWFDINGTSKKETYIDVAALALNHTISFLSKKYSSNIDLWAWGQLHKVTFAHVFGNRVPFISMNVGPAPSNGTTFTVNAGGGRGGDINNLDFSQTHGPSERAIYEVEPTWSNVYGLLPPGESGNQLSPHYADSFRNWLDVHYTKWVFNLDEVKAQQPISVVYRRV